MIETIQAFRTTDGKVFDCEEKAVEHEAREQLSKVLANPGLVNEILKSPLAVTAALTPLVSFIEHQNAPKAVSVEDR